jgi:hypothetical protein
VPCAVHKSQSVIYNRAIFWTASDQLQGTILSSLCLPVFTCLRLCAAVSLSLLTTRCINRESRPILWW